MVEMKIQMIGCFMFTRGDDLRTRGPHGRNVEGYMFTRGDGLRTRGPHGRNKNINDVGNIEDSMFTRGDEIGTRGSHDRNKSTDVCCTI